MGGRRGGGVGRGRNGVRLGPVRDCGSQRADAGGDLLHRRERIHPHLRADADREHGARLALPVRGVPRLLDRGGARQDPRSVDRGAHRRQPRDGHRRVPAAAFPARLDGWPGPAPGARHDRAVDHRRRPAAHPVRRRQLPVQPAGRHLRQHRPVVRRQGQVLDIPAVPRRGRDRRGCRAVAASKREEGRHDHPRRHRRSPHALCARRQRAPRVPSRVRRRCRARRPRRRARRERTLDLARRGRPLPPVVAGRRDRRRHGQPVRRRDRRRPHRRRRAVRSVLLAVLRPARHDVDHGRGPGAATPRPAGPPGMSRLSPRGLAIGVFLAVLIAFPLFASRYWSVSIAAHSLILGIIALSLIFLAGYGGMVSLAQTAVAGVASYAVAILTVPRLPQQILAIPVPPHWPEYLAVPVALVAATGVGLLFGWIAVRSQGIYLLMLTVALGVGFFYLAEQNYDYFGGHGGIPEVRASFGYTSENPTLFYYICLASAAVLYLGVRYLVRTPFGLALQGIRDNPRRMRALGYWGGLHRVAAFAIAGFMAGGGGGLT